MKTTHRCRNVLILFLAAMTCGAMPARALEVKSPDGRICLAFEVKDFDGAAACPVYSVTYRGKVIVAPSRMGFDLAKGSLKDGLKIVRQTESSADTTWKPVYGERNTIRDHYNQIIVELREQNAPHRQLQLTLRAYDEGAAFCYAIPKQPGVEKIDIARELTEFRFLGDHTAWATYTAQGVIAPTPLSKIKPGCERPLVIRVADDVYAALAEVRCVDYARTKFAPLPGKADSLTTELGSAVQAALPLRTPWRVVMLAESPAQLLEHHDIMLNLNDPCAIADTSWIVPGKVIRETSLTTLGGKACIDFAVKHNLQYIEFDAGWYGPEKTGDPRAVQKDRALDLPECIRYGKERGVGVILYVNQGPMEKHLDEILPLYRRWGVKGVKYGFVNVGTQKWTAWLHEAIRKAAEQRLMVDVHDEYRPTGWSRTYPNLMTVEGIRGDEEKQENGMSLNSLFTRMLAGPADNTICYYDPRVDKQATHAYQLAKAVCFYSPWQFLYWYDRPFISREATGRDPGSSNILGDEPELEFFDRVPTVWDETLVLQGSIGQYAVVARRSGENWFIGGMNADKPRTFDVPLRFLTVGKRYTAHVYSDDPAAATRTHVKIERSPVDRSTVLKLSLPARGGQAIRIVPSREKEN